MLILKLFIEYQIAGFAHDACKLAQETCRTLHSADGQYQHMLFKPKVIVPEILSVNLWRSRQLLQYVHAKIATVAMSQEFIEKRLTTGKHRPTATPFVDSVRELARIVWKFKSIREYEKWVERYRMTRPFRRMLSKAMILNVVKIFVEKLKRDSARVRKYEGMQKEHPLESALDQDDIMRFLLPLVSYHRRHHLAQLDTIRLHFIRRLGALPMLMKSARKMTRLLSKTPHELHSLVFRSMQHVVDAEQSPLGLGFSAELNPADRYLLDNLFRRLTTTTEIKALRILADGDHPFHSLVVEIHERFAIVNMRRVILLEREPLEQESSDTLDSMRFSETSSEVTDYTMRVIYACQFTKYGAKSNKLLALLTQMQDICRHIHEQFKPLRAQFVENEEEEINHRSITTNVVITKDVFVEHASELLEKASWKQHRDHTLRRMLVPTLIGDRIDPPVQNPFLAPYVAYWKSRTFIIKAMTSQTREQLKEGEEIRLLAYLSILRYPELTRILQLVVFRFYKYLSGIDEIVALKQLRRHVKDRQSPRRKKGVVGPRQPSVTQKRKKNLLNISDKHISISSQPTIESIEDKRQEKEPEGIEQKETPDFTSFLQAAAAAAVGAQRSSTLEIDSYLLETTTAQPATSIPPETVDDVFHRNKPLTQMWTSSVQRVSRVDRTLRKKILQQRMRWDQERMEHGMDLLRGRLSTQTNAQQDQEQQRRNLWEQRFQKRDHHSLLSI